MKISSAKKMENMRHEIMITVRANNVPVTGDFWFALIFRTESELVKMCQELNIKII